MFSTPVCDGKITMQYLTGSETVRDQHEYCHFKCADCGVNCYQKRELGIFYDSGWVEWSANGLDELREIGEVSILQNDVICQHISRKVIPLEKNATEEIIRFQCPDCNMNCKFERSLGYFWNGPWFRIP